MKSKIVAATFAVCLGALALDAAAQAKPEVLVKQRQAAMTLQAKYLGPLGAMAQGKAPFDAKVVQRNAAFLHALSQMPWDGFAESTKGEKSAALPAIWEKPGEFKPAAERFEHEAATLQQVSMSGDEGAVKAQIGATAKACGACHENFREKR